MVSTYKRESLQERENQISAQNENPIAKSRKPAQACEEVSVSYREAVIAGILDMLLIMITQNRFKSVFLSPCARP
jgi:hypothetical protein